ncbi:YhgE/Pip domain-containing protein [Enterococcus saccharolyticus]|uniref:YhgE/Pip domain-containing protein n=1 Tax=Enterococcus saccharolyticus TaxID=41997 RepID=UPI0003A61FF7|nr:YhgE/Pip domain-containing protein [Enterococcus saccharolyticus]OJG87885.1 hypothetical protein RV16_GL000406 [Enterococcus saccharolyticus]
MNHIKQFPQHLKNTWALYKLDWKRLASNPITIFLVIALMALPSLYAWFNIKALWDPYGNTNEIPIAVYSDDEGSKLQDKDIEIGDQVIETLHDNDQLGWRFVNSKEELTEGVKSGKYFAGIYIPKNFSKDLLSFTSGEIKKPEINYYFNEKINAIAPKITAKGASSLQEQITENFIRTASETLLKALNEIGYNVESNLVSINKIKNLILEVDENADKIDGYTKDVLEFQAKFPELKEKLGKADEFVAHIPEIDAMGEKLVAMNEKMPQIEKQAKVILTLQEKIPEIENAGRQIAMIDEDFDNISATLTEGIGEAKQGLQIIQDVQALLPKVQQLSDDASFFADKTIEAASKLDDNLDGITQAVQTNFEMITGLATTVNNWANTLGTIVTNAEDLTPEERAAIKQTLTDIATSLEQQQQIVTDLINWLSQLQSQLDGDFSGPIARLTQVRDLMSSAQKTAANLAANVGTISKDEIQQFLQQLESLSGNLAALSNDVNVGEISQSVRALLENKLIPGLTNAQDLLADANKIDLDGLLSSTAQTVTNAIDMLEKYEKEMPALGKEIHDANIMLNGHMDDIVNGINKGVDLYQNDLPELTVKLNKAADFVVNDWPGLKNEVTTTLNTVHDKLPTVESALDMAAGLIENEWPSLKQGLHKAATAIHKGEEIADLGEIIKLLKSDAKAESDFFTTPVELKTTTMYPIENNGSASTPFYTALCLWVGALLLSSVAGTGFHLDEKDKKRFSKREMFVARMMTFLTFAIGQALIVTLGNYYALGVDVREPVYSVLFGLIVALAFMMMIYVFVGLFGNVGKGIGIILLVLSISGGGGNYPIQVSGPFFQFIHPLLPFTYAVNLLRESAGGIYWANATTNLWVLGSIFVVFGILGTVLCPFMEKPMARIEELAHKSHFFH